MKRGGERVRAFRIWQWFMRPYLEDIESGDAFEALGRWPGPDKLVALRIVPALGILVLLYLVCLCLGGSR